MREEKRCLRSLLFAVISTEYRYLFSYGRVIALCLSPFELINYVWDPKSPVTLRHSKVITVLTWFCWCSYDIRLHVQVQFEDTKKSTNCPCSEMAPVL